ncbi:unnamed protein product (macronuclear) [Paramecium tetraurelia]|uniref:protein-tyrosine-phosphatase n=1 Tax=Paramecium tetraurelia TaxID=5888 RepID=A0C9G1_PARTE|nr:uncharacterized protein GSPATT00006734001 [Paramecium tetraurelia]CAK67428.1 unnamed protein product [Paramecium tetraurelia]|eukprot:XP_001434825.1 hypothetical protein (macronuclear) [Paramecium tetraurelia strain d4-2]
MYQSSPEKRKQMQMHGRPMEDMTCIIDCGYIGSLFLGNIESATDLAQLKKNRITAILSICVSKIPFTVSSQMKQYEHIILEDSENENIYRYFNSSFEFIDKGRQSGNVLVHCMAGISRSAALVAAYLMRKHNMSSKEALQQLERKRWQVYPNDGFIKQLLLYEKELNQQEQEITYNWNGKIIYNQQNNIKSQTSSTDRLITKISKFNDDEAISNEYSKIRKKYIDEEKSLDFMQKSNQYQLQQQRKTQFEILNNGINIQIQRLQQLSASNRNLNAFEPKQTIITDNQQKKRALMDAINNFSKNTTNNKGIQLETTLYVPKKQEFSSKYLPTTTRDQPQNYGFKAANNYQQKLDTLLNQFGKKSTYQYN